MHPPTGHNSPSRHSSLRWKHAYHGREDLPGPQEAHALHWSLALCVQCQICFTDASDECSLLWLALCSEPQHLTLLLPQPHIHERNDSKKKEAPAHRHWRKQKRLNQSIRIRPLLRGPRGGGVYLGLGQGSATHPPTHPSPYPSTLCLYPPPTVTYRHLIEKPPLAVVRRKDATPCHSGTCCPLYPRMICWQCS